MTGPTIFDDIEQGTEKWRLLRCGLPTASEFHSILAKGEGKTRRSYLLRLAAEQLTGEPFETFESAAMIRGREMEQEARELYAFAHDAYPQRVGFIRNGSKGCSPDALLGDDGLLEIKTKRGDLLIDCLLKDEFPSEHRAQCQGGLWVSEREWVDLTVFWPGLPLFVKRQARDESYIKNLAAEVDRFNDELAETVERIRRYGAPPVKAPLNILSAG